MNEDGDDCRLPRASTDVDPGTKALMRCDECGATFHRSDVRAATKGTLVCPECASRAIRDVTDSG
ncbi:hypothetical protein [Halegenticoccus tardaugens]|uniref:hypothetical protein n=1 Tax=Halegenticoccus tardaugens TaxID=2071624 RepID=UPI00100A3B44|nr:hypothetical protein [Halegenticoccus tardaugens]